MRKISIFIVFLLILTACFNNKEVPEKEDVKKENNETKLLPPIVINYTKEQLELNSNKSSKYINKLVEAMKYVYADRTVGF